MWPSKTIKRRLRTGKRSFETAKLVQQKGNLALKKLIVLFSPKKSPRQIFAGAV
jgi:hypothetical protein